MDFKQEYNELSSSDQLIIDRAIVYIYNCDYEPTKKEICKKVGELIGRYERNMFLSIIDALTQ